MELVAQHRSRAQVQTDAITLPDPSHARTKQSTLATSSRGCRTQQPEVAPGELHSPESRAVPEGSLPKAQPNGIGSTARQLGAARTLVLGSGLGRAMPEFNEKGWS